MVVVDPSSLQLFNPSAAAGPQPGRMEEVEVSCRSILGTAGFILVILLVAAVGAPAHAAGEAAAPPEGAAVALAKPPLPHPAGYPVLPLSPAGDGSGALVGFERGMSLAEEQDDLGCEWDSPFPCGTCYYAPRGWKVWHDCGTCTFVQCGWGRLFETWEQDCWFCNPSSWDWCNEPEVTSNGCSQEACCLP